MPVQTGAIIAKILSGCWRDSVPATDLKGDDLEKAQENLIASGAAALASRRIKHCEALAQSLAGAALVNEARLLSIRTMMQDAAVAELGNVFAENGLDALMFKGRAIAQHYFFPHLRPTGDIDVLVTPDRFSDAAGLLQEQSSSRQPLLRVDPKKSVSFNLIWDHPVDVSRIDLHGDLSKFRFSDASRLINRSPVYGKTGLRAPNPTDHFQILCLHFLVHGGWRPLWLCDIAATAENCAAEIDWDHYGDPIIQNWIATSLHLARDLLGADLSTTPDWVLDHHQPQWLKDHVLHLWGLPYDTFKTRASLKTMARAAPMKFPSELLARWPSPISAIMRLGKPYEGRNKFIFQLTFALSVAMQSVFHLYRKGRFK